MRDAEVAHVGEVGQAHPAGLVLLAEDDVPLGAMQRPPRPDAPLQRAPHASAAVPDAVAAVSSKIAMAAGRRRLQHRHDLGLEDRPSGSGRRRPRGAFFCDGSRGSLSIR